MTDLHTGPATATGNGTSPRMTTAPGVRADDLHTLMAMVRHARAWMPYGGDDEQILPRFGLTPEVFYGRILTALHRHPVLLCYLGPAVHQQLAGFCARKLNRHGSATSAVTDR